MKRIVSTVITLALSCSLVLGQQTSATARLKGTVLDTNGAAISNVQITVQDSTRSFKVVSDEYGRFQIDLPPGKYEVRSDKLPGFAATKREVTVETSKAAEITIVPAISLEGAICILYVTSGPTKKPKRRKRHR